MDNAALDILTQAGLRVGLCSSGIAKRPNIDRFLGLKNAILSTVHRSGNCDLYIGWGHKKSGHNAIKFAKETGAQFLLLEDAFVRSYAPQSVHGEQPYGLILDDQGIYYDAHKPSRLEALIANKTGDQTADHRGALIINDLCGAQICKYNNFQPMSKTVQESIQNGGVLVVDQTYQDQSIIGAKADDQSFTQMIEAAIDENPSKRIFVKLHPEVMAGKKRGYLKKLAVKYNCILLTENFNPWDFFSHIQKVYTVSSQLGFDALMAGCQVRCFGQPFYSGWGLTQDHTVNPLRQTAIRTSQPTINQITYAAYDQYARYLDPYDRSPTDVTRVISDLSHIRNIYDKNREIESFYQVTAWKRQRIKKMFKPYGSTKGPNGKLFFQNPSKAIQAAKIRGGSMVAWSSRIDDSLQQACRDQGVSMLRLEDGFVRSVGLGANFNLPMSLIIDRKGIYYDPRQASDLEDILEKHAFTTQEKQRAADLAQVMVHSNITKYNLNEQSSSYSFPENKKIILVPGQVDSDASIKYGGNSMTAIDILSKVRATNHDAYIIFKPHPDVCSGQKPGLLDENLALKHADFFAEGMPIEQLITLCNEVHTISSLTGFEALLRHKKVMCYGMPFYAGWGLTSDTEHCPRRTRKLSLEELIAGTLILYPRYFDPKSNLPCGPELIIKRIEEERLFPQKPSLLVQLRSSYGKIRRFLHRN